MLKCRNVIGKRGDKMSIGENIRKYRKAAGLTRDDLAALVHVEEKEIAYWERGFGVPDEMLVYRIASSLGVSPDEIAGGAPVKTAVNETAKIHDGAQQDFLLKIVTPVEDILKKGENLIWAGRPSMKNGVGLLSAVQAIFGSLWMIALLFWALKAVFMYPPAAIVGVPLIAAGAFFAVSKYYKIKKQRRSTYYAITDERVIIKYDYKNETVKSIYLDDINTIRIEEGGHGAGNIIFVDREGPSGNAPAPFSFKFFSPKGFSMPLDGFYDIENVNKVCDILRNMLQ